MPFSFSFPYKIAAEYSKKVAYCCMEFGIHQPLKIYAGGLGFLAGSHLRSAFELNQNLVGIGILWKYGYYDQIRKPDQTMDVLFEEKNYGFLIDTGIRFPINVSKHQVWVTAFYLPPHVFNTAPLFLLSTNLPENDYLARTISHKLYDANPETKIASAILLGVGSVKLMEAINWIPDVYHLNESHALPLIFHLYDKYRNIKEVQDHLVFTNHTPEEAGNQKTNMALLDKMDFFCRIPITEIRAITHTEGEELDHTLCALQLSKKANAVSLLHHKTIENIWKGKPDTCEIISITNAQNFTYWHDDEMYQALANNIDEAIVRKKKKNKQLLFDIVADQSGEIYNTDICTIIFAKRFSDYKRADLFFHDMESFHKLVTNKELPVQIIWAGKPYPMDYNAIGVFDKIVDMCKKYSNCSILVGYELRLSAILKKGADIWLNLPRVTHEASGTSGMTAAMNGAVNVGFPDGWFPEFARDKINSFIIPPSDLTLPDHIQDDTDAASLYHLLEKEVLPMYYNYPLRWNEIVKNGLHDIIPQFDSNRMVKEYYEKMY